MYITITDCGGGRRYLSGARVVAFNFETNPDPQWRDNSKAALDSHRSHIVGVSFSIASGNAVYLPIHHIYGRNSYELDIFTVLREFAANSTVTKVAHHLACEATFLYHLGHRDPAAGV
ncbi:MAG: hypothetical protein LBS11_07200 [Oscillospiraceae bacterium]|nr:hypothetical protein [Oscillospiraceae bacterium]